MDDTDTHQEIKFQHKKKKKTHKNVESGQSFSCAIAVFAMHLKPLKLRQLCLISLHFIILLQFTYFSPVSSEEFFESDTCS